MDADAQYEVVNIVCKLKLKKTINLWLLQMVDLNMMMRETGGIKIRYVPETFPGATISFEHPKVSVTLFQTGAGVITGAKNFQEVNLATKHIIKLMRLVEETNMEVDKYGILER